MSLTGKLPGSRSLPVKIYSAKAIPSIGPQGSRMPWRVSLTVRLKYGGCELVPIFWGPSIWVLVLFFGGRCGVYRSLFSR
ncbi:hypothetical protein H9L39_02036 [Fusarium oxysporum f. sp. albedinis]|nr:hypothetical protein H9L39_02036 [Fusarium oxysporum f. sp. albedinis]